MTDLHAVAYLVDEAGRTLAGPVPAKVAVSPREVKFTTAQLSTAPDQPYVTCQVVVYLETGEKIWTSEVWSLGHGEQVVYR